METLQQITQNQEIIPMQVFKVNFIPSYSRIGIIIWKRNLDIDETFREEYRWNVHKALRMVFNVSWSEHLTNRELHGNLPKVTEKIKKRI